MAGPTHSVLSAATGISPGIIVTGSFASVRRSTPGAFGTIAQALKALTFFRVVASAPIGGTTQKFPVSFSSCTLQVPWIGPFTTQNSHVVSSYWY